MHRLSIVALLFVSACSKSSAKTEETPTPGASASAAVVAAASSDKVPTNAAPITASWYAGTWKGELAATRRASATNAKEGAPGAWEKDGGQKYAGPGTIEIAVNDRGQVSGAVKGALGELGVRGQIDGDELRANLVSSSDDPTAIHNGTIVLAHDSDTLKGRLSAGSGDALTMRQADVTLKKAP